jgi:hypothetical protein
MSANFWKAATANAFNTTLNGNIAAGDTTITLTTTTNLQAPGVLTIDRQDANSTDTPTLREYVSFTGIAGNQITGVTRGLGSSTAQAHSSNAKVEETFSVSHWNDLLTALLNVFTSAGALDTTKVADLATAQTLTNKVINADNNTLTNVPAANLKIASQAQGDLLYRDAAAWARLAAGTSGQFLQSGGASANPSWVTANSFTPAYCKAHLTTGQSISNNTETAINFTAEEYDTDTMHNNVTNNTRITFTTAGTYLVGFTANWAVSNTTGRRSAALRKNGTTYMNGLACEISNANAANQLRLHNSGIYVASAADYMELIAFQTSGGSINMDEGDIPGGRTTIWATRIA